MEASHVIALVASWYSSSLGSVVLSKTLVGGGAKHVRPFMVALVQIAVSVACDLVFLCFILANANVGTSGRATWRNVLQKVPTFLPMDIQSLLPFLPMPLLIAFNKVLTFVVRSRSTAREKEKKE